LCRRRRWQMTVELIDRIRAASPAAIAAGAITARR
jgi:hypothetical protein